WNHVFITYDGSGKVGGVRIYVNGVPQENRLITADNLKNTIRTKVPLTLAQRHTTSPVLGASIHDLRIYGRALPATEVERLVKGTRAAWRAVKPADKRTAPETNELFDWWLPGMDREYQAVAVKLAGLQKEEAAIRARGAIAHVMQERDGEPGAFILF